MGIGHNKQQSLFKPHWQHQFSHGGSLRRKRAGRGARPLSTKEPLHVVFKIRREGLRHRSFRSAHGYVLVQKIIRRYSQRFYIKVEQLSIQHDHLHLLIRTSRRSQFHFFFRVVAGQIAQRFEKEGLLLKSKLKHVTDTPKSLHRSGSLWMYRPFSRVVRGYRAYKVIRDYIQLNEQEVAGKIKYQKNRLRGLSMSDWSLLWQ
jgi:REP element-mobilizing transposase RayT